MRQITLKYSEVIDDGEPGDAESVLQSIIDLVLDRGLTAALSYMDIEDIELPA
jgi:hypothetical protein